MITYKGLGRAGRLGNQLLQIFSTIGVAKDNNTNFVFPFWSYESRHHLKDCFVPVSSIKEDVTIEENHDGTYCDIIVNPSITTNLKGYLQSEKYFSKHMDFIRKHFYVERQSLDYYFLHVRRQDYLSLREYHPPIGVSWYIKAIEYLKNLEGITQATFMVFSDDLRWCMDIFQPYNGNAFLFADSDEVTDMQTMASCKGGIIANSSFSLVAALLGDRKPIVSPSVDMWFGSAYKGIKTAKDIIPDRFYQFDYS